MSSHAAAVVYSLLSTATPVTAIVADRIFPVVARERQPTPMIVYETVTSVPVGAIDAYTATHLTRTRVQVNVLTADYAVLRTLRDAVVAALRFQRGTIAGAVVHSILLDIEQPDQFDPALLVYMRGIDFLVTHEST